MVGQGPEGGVTKTLMPETDLNKWEAGRTTWKVNREGISLWSEIRTIKMKLANCHSPSVHI